MSGVILSSKDVPGIRNPAGCDLGTLAAREVKVALRATGDGIELIVADDGRGFRPDDARGAGGLGLISLDERVRLIGGSLAINTGLNRGTEMRGKVPLGRNR